MYSKVLEFTQAKWLIHGDALVSFLPLVVSVLNGAKISASDFSADHQKSKPFVIPSSLRGKHSNPFTAQANLVSAYQIEDENIPEDSIAVIPIQGVLYPEKVQYLQTLIQIAEDNDKISSILFLISSPGGIVNYIDITSSIIRDVKKPTTGFVIGICASAAMWLASGIKEIILSSKIDQVGSIGVKMSYYDWDKMLEQKLGVGIYKVYASLSEEKDFEIRELIKGNETPVHDSMDYVNVLFHQQIQENLGIPEDSIVFKGNVFYAEKAIELGLAHRIASFNDAVDSAFKKGQAYRLKSYKF